MVLAEDAMQRQLRPRRGCSLARQCRGWILLRNLDGKVERLARLEPSHERPRWIANLGGPALRTHLEMVPVEHIDKHGALWREGRYLEPIRDECVGTSLDRGSVLENAIFAEHLNRRSGLEQEIGASGKHEVRCPTARLYQVPLKQCGVAAHHCTIDLCLPAGHNEADARGRRSNTNQATAGEQRDGRL